MIRAFLVIVGLVAGLGAASVAGLRMAHLTILAAPSLPAAAARIDPASSLWTGSADLSAALGPRLPLPEATLSWRRRMPVPAGLRWTLVLTAPGTRLSAVATLGWTADRLHLADGTGRLDLTILARDTRVLPVTGATIRGNAVLTQGGVGIRLRPSPGTTAGQAELALSDLVLDVPPLGPLRLGSGSATLTYLPDTGDWTASVRLSDGDVSGTVLLTTRDGLRNIDVSAATEHAPALSPGWRALLDGISIAENGQRRTVQSFALAR